MVKVAIYPPNSLILADLIERKGHTPLVLFAVECLSSAH